MGAAARGAARVLGRSWGIAAAGTALLIAGALPEPAAAQEMACKTSLVTATGRGKFRPFTKTKELEGRGSAMADAVASWQREAAATFGEKWKLWERAKDTTFDCEANRPGKLGKLIAGNVISCTISGRPCAAAGGSDDRPAAVAGSAKTGDRDDDDDDSRVERRVGGWRYRREMVRQIHLAQQRQRWAEARWRREETRQRYLKVVRDSAERRGWARENARQRWLARVRDE